MVGKWLWRAGALAMAAAVAVAQDEFGESADPGAELLGSHREEGLRYLREVAEEEGMNTIEGGVMYQIIESSADPNAKSPREDSLCKVHYRGMLHTGEEFDSSYERGAPALFRPSALIQGWAQVMPMMSEGDKWRVIVPADLAYGARASSKIPAHSVLVFELHLLEVDPELSGMDRFKEIMQKRLTFMPMKMHVWQAIVLVVYITFRVYLKTRIAPVRAARQAQQTETKKAQQTETKKAK